MTENRLSNINHLKKMEMTPEMKAALAKAKESCRRLADKFARKREEERQRLLDIKDEF